MKKRTLVLALAIVLGVSACGGPAVEEAEDAQDGGDSASLTVALANTSCLVYASVYSGLEEGFFEEEGLDLNIEAVNGSAGVLQAMSSGQADFGGPGAIPVISAQARGEDFLYFLNANPGGSFRLLTPAENDISEPAELEGGVVGVATSDGNEVSFVEAIMEAAGVGDGDYEQLTVGEGGQAAAAFERGDIDAYAASSDGIATIDGAGLDPVDITPSGDVDYMFGNGFAAPQTLIDEQPEALEAYGRGLNRANQFITENQQEAIENCGSYQPQELEDQQYAEGVLQATIENSQSPYDDAQFGEMREEDWEEIMQDAVEAGNVEEGEANVQDVYTNELVDGFQVDGSQ